MSFHILMGGLFRCFLTCLVCGLLCLSWHHHPRVVRHRRELCAGGASPRGGRDRSVSARHWRLSAQLLWGSGLCRASTPTLCYQMTKIVFLRLTTLWVFFFLQYWAFSDIQTGKVLTKVTDESAGCGKRLLSPSTIRLLLGLILHILPMFPFGFHSSHVCSVPPRRSDLWNWHCWFSDQDLGSKGENQCGQLPRPLWTCDLHRLLWERILSGYRWGTNETLLLHTAHVYILMSTPSSCNDSCFKLLNIRDCFNVTAVYILIAFVLCSWLAEDFMGICCHVLISCMLFF